MKQLSSFFLGFAFSLIMFSLGCWFMQPSQPAMTSLTRIDTIYNNTTDTIKLKQLKIKQKYDTLYMYFLDSPYSTRLLDSAINIHRQLDAKGMQ
jgi:hypothetical protein